MKLPLKDETAEKTSGIPLFQFEFHWLIYRPYRHRPTTQVASTDPQVPIMV